MGRVKYTLLAIFLLATMNVFGQTMRKDSVLLHESWESNSTTASSWSKYASTGCSSYNWQVVSLAGKGALSSDQFMDYPSTNASTGCYSFLLSPKIYPARYSSNDSLFVDFYMYRAAVSTKDNLQVSILDENGTKVYGTAQVYVDESQSPASGTGWDHLTWKVAYSQMSSLSTTNFYVAFAGVSGQGAEILLDEISIHHIYYELVKSYTFTPDFTGDTLTEGDNVSVQWTSQNVGSPVIYYSSDSGLNYSYIGNTSSPFSWNVPTTATNHGFLKLQDPFDGTVKAISGPFVIANPLKLLNYNGGDSVMGGTTTQIKWRSRNTVSKADLSFSTDGGISFTSIAKGVSSSTNVNNSYPWNVPSVISKTAKIKIDGDDGSSIVSNADFKITHNSGIEEENAPGYFMCYPNPAHDNLSIQFPSALEENSLLKLYNVNGKAVFSQNLPIGLNKTSINLKPIDKGVYILEISNSKTISKHQVIVN